MLYPLLKFTHLLGTVLIGGGLISVWLSDLRSRQLREMPQALGAIRPETWSLFFAGSILAVLVALILTIWIPRLYPWGREVSP